MMRSAMSLRRVLPLCRTISSRASPVITLRNAPLAHYDSSASSPIVLPFQREVKSFTTTKNDDSKEVKSFTTTKDDDIKVPLSIPGVAGKYARALFVTTVQANALETVDKELLEVVEAARNSPTFADFLRDLSVPKEVQVKAILEIFGETKFSDITKNFMAVLAENGRLRLFEKIVEAYSEMILAYKGHVKATITTALELTPQELEGLKTALKGYIKPNQSLIINQKVDRSIIGGLVIDVEDKHIDLSVENRIRQIEQVIKEAFGEI